VRIAVDCRYVRLGTHDGISRFTVSLLAALQPLLGAEDELIALIHDERQRAMLPPGLGVHRISAPTSIRELRIAAQVNRIQPDVVFSPMQTMGSWSRKYPLVLTLHDLIYYVNRTPPRNLPAAVRVLWRLYHLAWWPQRVLLNRADAVVTVSETTRALIERHRLTRRRVVVVPNAAVHPAPAARTQPDHLDLVYMGSFMPYKNVETLCRALHELPGARLHLLSRIRVQDRDRFESLAPAGSLVIHDGVSDEEYASLLDGATALLHASRDEGFGIPLVEAMGRGTPVVVADTAIFREIGGEAALYASAENPTEFAARVRELLQPGQWQARSRAGLAQAARFDWNSSAQTLLELITELATSRSDQRGAGDRSARR
jgi:glycosyltransferase involved in cell wall biosynthesis